MKRGFYGVLILVTTMHLYACRKTRTCECTTTNQVTSAQVVTQSEFRATKKDGEAQCNNLAKNEGDFITECSIK